MALVELSRISVTLSINWKITLLGLLLLPVLLRLGFWQLDRAEQKQVLVESINQLQAMPIVSLENLLQGDMNLQYRQVSVQGEFMPERYWLVDNRVHLGKVGYEVIAPFVLTDHKIILINRGWIAAPARRSELPSVAMPAGAVELRGRLTRPSDNRMVRTLEVNQQWPKRIQQLLLPQAEDELKAELLPWVLQLSAESPYALVMKWRDVNVSPAKHQGYAVQWFSMSLALFIALIVVNINVQTNKERDKTIT